MTIMIMDKNLMKYPTILFILYTIKMSFTRHMQNGNSAWFSGDGVDILPDTIQCHILNVVLYISIFDALRYP